MIIKVVVAIVGVNRSLSHTYQSIEQFVLRPLNACPLVKLSVTLGFIRPANDFVDNPHSGEYGVLERNLPRGWRDYPRRDFDMEEAKTRVAELLRMLSSFPDRWGDNYKSVENLLVELHTQKSFFDSELSDGANSVVIFLRPDCRIESSLNVVTRVAMLWIAQKFGFGVAIVPSWGRAGGVNDRFAILNRSAARTYFRRIDAIEVGAWSRGFHAEEFLAWALRKVSVFDSVSTLLSRVRLGGVVADGDLKRLLRKQLVTNLDG